jgi:hypothetical protein
MLRKYYAKAVVSNNQYLFQIIRRIVWFRIEKNCEKKYYFLGDNIHRWCNESRLMWGEILKFKQIYTSFPNVTSFGGRLRVSNFWEKL